MKKLIIILATTSFFACNKSDEVSPQFNLDVIFELSVFNSQNEDLLDPATTNHYEEAGIKLFYEVYGEMIEVYDPNMDSPRNFMIYKHENEYRIQVTLNYSDTSNKPITYIQWNNNETDTLKVLLRRGDGFVLKRNVWLNGLEIWDWTTNEDGYYKLIK